MPFDTEYGFIKKGLLKNSEQFKTPFWMLFPGNQTYTTDWILFWKHLSLTSHEKDTQIDRVWG